MMQYAATTVTVPGVISIPSSSTMTLDQVIQRQAPTVDGWVCPGCRHHRGNLNCAKNMFISVVGANMSGCCGYEKERRNG